MSNKKDGNRLEQHVCDVFASRGWWVYNFPQRINGQQPADIIAINGNNLPVLIDCKNCKGDRFLFQRIEYNQLEASELWEKRTGSYYYLAIGTSDDIYMIHIDLIKGMMDEGKKSIAVNQLQYMGLTLTDWLRARQWS